MSPQFNDKEKQSIREALLAAGKDLFAKFGLKKTNIDDLTHRAGIAKGSFYRFFQSKEELYFDIFLIKEKKLRENLFTHTGTAVTPEHFKTLLFKGFSKIWRDPILRRLYTTDEYKLLLRKLPKEKIRQHTDQDVDFLLPLILKWQKEKRMVDIKPDLIVSALRSIFILGLHKDEIGKEYFEDTIKLLIDLVVNGLFLRGQS